MSECGVQNEDTEILDLLSARQTTLALLCTAPDFGPLRNILTLILEKDQTWQRWGKKKT